MAIDSILKRIDEETSTAVGKILEKARLEAEAIAGEYAGRVDRIRETLEDRARRKAAEEEKRIIVNEQLELRKAVLARKREILDELYRGAADRIRGLPEREYLDLLKTLILKRAVTGREVIVVPADQRGLFGEDFLASLNAAYGPEGHFTLSDEEGVFTWGVVLRQERRTIDLTLDVLLEQLKERVEHRIASTLFAEK
jgi:V/A-type H+-transporting ATPase subunit E